MSNKFSFKNSVIFGGNFTAANEVRGDNGRQMLSQSPYVQVHGAIHDSGQRYPPSECHPGTREDILRMAETWVDKSLSESESMLFWLSGPAGVGKTAIAQSRLGGDFFFSRSVAGHGNFHTLFPTLAYQLGIIYPEFGFELDAVMKEDASVLTKNLEVQLRQLLVNPLNRAENKPDTPFVLVIDGLDEAGGEDDQISFLHLLAWHFLPHRLPLKIIVTSRPEPWIKSSFATNPLRLHTHNHFLRRTSQTDDDIRTLLISKFAEIQGTHDLMKNRAESWPPCEIIDDIVDKASGQFIYASTVLRFIADPNGNPAQRLLWIVNAWSRSPSRNVKPDYSPYSALDNLYQHILSTSSNIENTLALLGASIAHGIDRNRYLPIWLKSPPSPSIALLEKLLMLREGDGFLAVRMIQSLVEILPDGSIQFYHKSFQDFILDSNRSGEYFTLPLENIVIVDAILRERFFVHLRSN
ncbi:hypothetical protein BDN70DRAFT_923173 [Pholiota conissans]|uniref:Nephrocystin 3-like N-terminal domain-containing protein n=1 Tax=Pholiota conissans TaxID=109636 RepID=A0A9P5YVS7_9AGAR|nr:hypothetical protein BDN70DRAFT_923173 [Pholiota conissans]